jgi:amino-acid N-acetyltransferase
MESQQARIDAAHAADAAAIFALLEQHHLPLDGLRDRLATTVVARTDGGQIVGSAALEIYRDGALLRSVAIAADRQQRGLGRQLTESAIALARDRQVRAIYLLTTTAAEYFQRFGFQRIARAEVPPGVQTSVEFTSACPSSATVMRKTL